MRKRTIAIAVVVAGVLGVAGLRIVQMAADDDAPASTLGFIGGGFTGGGGSGGGGGSCAGDITAVTATSPIAGGCSSGSCAVSMSSTGCLSGDAWISDGAGGWSCDPAGASGAGDITAVVAGAGLSGGATSGSASLKLSETGCIAGDVPTFVSADTWSCDPPAGGGGSLNPSTEWLMRDEMFGPGNSGANAHSSFRLDAATGTATATTLAESGRPGVVTLQRGTTAAGRAMISTHPTGVVYGTANLTNIVEWWVNIDDVSNGTDTYTFRAGTCDSVTADCVDGIYFEAPADGSNWDCKTALNSVRETTDSTVAVVADAWVKLRYEVDALTAVRFYIDGVQVCAAHDASQVPTGAGRQTSFGAQVLGTAGTAERIVKLDLFQASGTVTAR